jgi:hypothetical protein
MGTNPIIEASDKCPRWRKIAIDQLGYALNLILTFAVATLGYWFVLLRDHDFNPVGHAKCSMILSLAALAISAFCGCSCVLTRLLDFRGTARRACNHPDAPAKAELSELGAITWILFTIQLVMFALGALSLAVALLLTYGDKLK